MVEKRNFDERACADESITKLTEYFFFFFGISREIHREESPPVEFEQ